MFFVIPVVIIVWFLIGDRRIDKKFLFVLIGLVSSLVVFMLFKHFFLKVNPDAGYANYNKITLKGLLIDGGFLVGESLPDGSNDNQLLGSNFLLLRFVGNLPTYVSMNVSAAFNQAVFLNAFGEDGWLAQKQTSGYAGPYNEIPYIDNQLVSFYAPEGISFITLEAFYGLRTGAVVDNLFYDYSTSVPEPSLFILLISGLLMIALSSGIHRQRELVRK